MTTGRGRGSHQEPKPLNEAWLDFAYEFVKSLGLIRLCERLGMRLKPWIKERQERP